MKYYPVIWSDRAWRDLDAIFDFIARNARKAAERQLFRIIDRGEQLSVHPRSGPMEPNADPELNARYLVQDDYKLIYFVDNDRVVIDTVFDTRQDPEKLKL